MSDDGAAWPYATPIHPTSVSAQVRYERNTRKAVDMAGVVVVKTLSEALRAGYHVYERTERGYLVRTRTSAGWAMAIVSCGR